MSGGLYRDLRVGDRVALTEEGCRQGLQGRARTPFGVVVLADPQRYLIKVRRDGIKGAGWYSPDFWERREDSAKFREEGVALKNQLVNAFVQGAQWMSKERPIPTEGWIVVEARRQWNRGVLGTEGLARTSAFIEDFSEDY